MPDVEMVFWRAITAADFFNVERSRQAAPLGGGGQSYISISFSGLTHEELGAFLQVVPPSLIATERPTVPLDVRVVDDPEVRAPLVFAARYRPPRRDDRYRITRQNRQFQRRHPAWTRERGFPEAPDDVLSSGDPRLPDLANLKVYVVRTDEGDYLAGFVNSSERPAGFPADPRLDALFQPFELHRSAGLIELEPGAVSLEDWVAAARAAAGADDSLAVPPEVVEAREVTRVAAGRRPRGQGRRLSSAERQAVELHAMELARERLEDDWDVDDVSAHRPYDLHCRRGDEELRVEVKGTTGDGTILLLTPGEVRHARDHAPAVALVVVAGIALIADAETEEVFAEGGAVTIVRPWDVDDGELRPTGFEYHRP
jgi:hypothetical protein